MAPGSRMPPPPPPFTPGTPYEFPFTPLLPSQLLLGSPFQTTGPTSAAVFSSNPQYAPSVPPQPLYDSYYHHSPGISSSSPSGAGTIHHSSSAPAGSPSSQGYPAPPYLVPPPSYSPFYDPDSSNSQHHHINHHQSNASPLASRTIYLGNVPSDTTAEELLSHIHSGTIESAKILPDKNCAFISFLEPASASHFHSDAILKKMTIKNQEIKIGWGKPSAVNPNILVAVRQYQVSRNVYLGNLPEGITCDQLYEDMGKFGPIDMVKIVPDKNIAFVHFMSISSAMKAVQQLPLDPVWAHRRVFYGKDRCAYVSKTQQQNAAQFLGINNGNEHVLAKTDPDMLSTALAQQSSAAATVATISGGGPSNVGNRTVYLGSIHPETSVEEICNVIRGGLLHHIRFIPDKHICFVTFIDPTAAAQFYALVNLQGLMIHNRRLKIGWGKHSGPLPNNIALAVAAGASRNVYVGNVDDTWTEQKLRSDFSQFGELEQINFLREKSCVFINFTNITNSIKAIEGIKQYTEYKPFKISFGKDRCGNPPRPTTTTTTSGGQQQQQQHQQKTGSINKDDAAADLFPLEVLASQNPHALGNYALTRYLLQHQAKSSQLHPAEFHQVQTTTYAYYQTLAASMVAAAAASNNLPNPLAPQPPQAQAQAQASSSSSPSSSSAGGSAMSASIDAMISSYAHAIAAQNSQVQQAYLNASYVYPYELGNGGGQIETLMEEDPLQYQSVGPAATTTTTTSTVVNGQGSPSRQVASTASSTVGSSARSSLTTSDRSSSSSSFGSDEHQHQSSLRRTSAKTSLNDGTTLLKVKKQRDKDKTKSKGKSEKVGLVIVETKSASDEEDDNSAASNNRSMSSAITQAAAQQTVDPSSTEDGKSLSHFRAVSLPSLDGLKIETGVFGLAIATEEEQV